MTIDGYQSVDEVRPFAYWCHKILPLVYDDSLSYYEQLCRVVDKLNEVVDAVAGYDDSVAEALNGIEVLKAEIVRLKQSLAGFVSENQVQEIVDREITEFEGRIEEIYLPASELSDAINMALARAKESGEFDGPPGANGERGGKWWGVTTAPAQYTTAVDGHSPKWRIALSTALSQSQADEILAGDTLQQSYYTFPVIYVTSDYVYLGTRVTIRGAKGATGDAGTGITDITITEV